MGRKKAAGGPVGLGRALIRERSQARGRGRQAAGWLHSSELNDGYNWGRLNLQSVTEQSSLDDFLATAELAGTEFVAEKLNIKFVPPEARTGLLTPEETKRIEELHEENKRFLCIPRRPYWDKRTSAEKLKEDERGSFLEWRRQLARLEEEQKLILTPFERNLDFWRQLWRVLERSDIVVQIVDARNPLLFRCQDLENYVKEISQEKENVILVNKADLLTREQRAAWASFFESEGIKVVFWSALAEGRRLSTDTKGQGVEEAAEQTSDSEDERSDQEESPALQDGAETRRMMKPLPPGGSTLEESESDASDVYEDCEGDEDADDGWQTCSEAESGGEADSPSRTDAGLQESLPVRNDSHLVQRDELLGILKALHSGKKVRAGEVTVGLVGYPNVGKSSTINTILGNKKVSVSATPGHTKHFQTLYVEPSLCLCDCPGLVMPSFVATKAEMICCGILPIDQMRDHVPPVSLVCQRVPRRILEATYGINIIRPREDEDPDRQPTAEELLMAYGYMRGFMTMHGQPDQPRSARYVLKDYVSENVRALTKGAQAVMGYRPGSGLVPAAASNSENAGGKPWKKHGNRNKKEKTRRITKHLDA
uniref:Large subunit GTPase 1 homolog n=1 Tax=Sphenodon punctatus TaxID=8508 RepID=A0A8D0HM36_SPHPU